MLGAGVELERIRTVLAAALPQLEVSHSVQMDFHTHRVEFVRRGAEPDRTSFYVSLSAEGTSAEQLVHVRSLKDGKDGYHFDGPLAAAAAYLVKTLAAP